MASTLIENDREVKQGFPPQLSSYATMKALGKAATHLSPVGAHTADQVDCNFEAPTLLLVDPADDDEDLPSADPELASQIGEAMARFPKVGSEFLGFRLIHELGRGGFGRVFLAQQIDLANRLVALKVSVDLRGESQRLAQLQHTNIMPLFSEHCTPKLHAVCMPYLGSTTLADICRVLSHSNVLPTSGRHLVSTLYNRQTTVHSSVQSSPSVSSVEELTSDVGELVQGRLPRVAKFTSILAHIENLSYQNAILWIGARLAAALQHAHERGILHRDLKPANILLTDDGEPMILDFNLAEDMKLRSSATAKIGGTLPYMSPEQLVGYLRPSIELDGRSDIYSLGLILFQLLTGKFPFPVHRGRTNEILPRMIHDRQALVPQLRTLNPSITPAVEAIIQRCLQPDRELRYTCAEELLEDIERHQKNLPLKFTPEPSFAERLRKWTRRNPRLASPQVLAAGLASLGLVITLVLSHWSYRKKERALDGQREFAINYYHEFVPLFQQAESLLSVDDPEQLQEGIETAQKALSAYHVLEDSQWNDKPEVKHLPPEDRQRLQQEVGELGFLLARSVAYQPKEKSTEEMAQRYHDLAAANLGEQEQLVLAVHRSELNGRPTLEDYQNLRLKLEASAKQPGRSPILIASDMMVHGHYLEALKLLKEAVERDRDDFGCWYLRASCHQALNEEAEALHCLGVCITLRPKFARSYHTRASILYSARKNLPQAKADLDQALRLQPNLLAAYIDRGLVLHAMNKDKEALEDLNWALSCPGVPKRVYFIRSVVRKSLNDKIGSDQDQAEGLKQQPTDSASWASRGYIRLRTAPKAALEDFIEAEKLNPRSVPAIMNQSYVLGECLKKPKEAIVVLDRLLDLFPDSVDGRVAKAIYLARLGKSDDAVDEIKKALAKSQQPDTLYRAACVYALLSEKKPEYKQEGLSYLAKALKHGCGFEELARDSDLIPFRKLEEFTKFLDLVKTLEKWNHSK